MNVVIPKNTAVNLLDVSGIAIGTPCEIVNLSNRGAVGIFNTATVPNADDDFLPCVYGTNKVITNASDLGVWALSSIGGSVDIREI